MVSPWGPGAKNEGLIQALMDAGNQSGDRLWPLPIWDSYGKDLESDVADIKNLGAQPVAGAIRAAKFLEFFTNNHPAWAHLDIAGSAAQFTGPNRSASGRPVPLLVQYLINEAEK